MSAKGWLGVGLLALGVTLGTAGCGTCSRTAASESADASTAAEPEPSIAIPAKTGPAQVHPSGLTLLPQSAAYNVQSRDFGFRVDPANARSQRTPWSVELRFLSGPQPAKATSKSKQVGEHAAHFALQVDEEAGSGGALHTLTAWAACGSGELQMRASQQAEPPARPDWSAAWQLLAASGCTPP